MIFVHLTWHKGGNHDGHVFGLVDSFGVDYCFFYRVNSGLPWERSSAEVESFQGKTYLILSAVQFIILIMFAWQISSSFFLLDCAGGYALFWLGQSAMAAFASPGL